MTAGEKNRSCGRREKDAHTDQSGYDLLPTQMGVWCITPCKTTTAIKNDGKLPWRVSVLCYRHKKIKRKIIAHTAQGNNIVLKIDSYYNA